MQKHTITSLITNLATNLVASLVTSLAIFTVALFTLALPMQASAQDQAALEEIVVTGSNIRRKRDFDTPSPIQTLGLEEIEGAGAGQVQDLFKNLSVNAGSETSTSQNGRQGVSQFSLRGLGVSGTLTLVNGRRAGVSPISSDDGFFFTDVNQYPVNMIERVEILTDGASATYGSEAVSGVVNIITRNNFEGAEFGVEFRDATNSAVSLNAAFGSSFEKGHFSTFINYYTQDGNYRGEFDWLRARDNDGDQLNTASLWDSGTGAGRYNLVNAEGSRTGNTIADPACGSPNQAGVVNTFESGNNCRYSFINQRRLIPEEDRLQIFSQFDYALTDSVQLFSEFSYSQNEIRDVIGGAVLRSEFSYSQNEIRDVIGGAVLRTDNGDFLIPSSHPFNYFTNSGDTLVWDPAGIQAGTVEAADVIFRGRPQAGQDGPLADDITRKYDNGRFVLGFDADLSDAWSLNASYMYSRSQFSDRQPRSYNANAFRKAVQEGVWNPFGSAWADPTSSSIKNGQLAGNDASALEVISANRVFQSEAIQQVVEVILSGDVFELGNGNMVVAAFGAQYRDLEYNDIADSLSEFRLDGRADPVFSINDASQDVYALFAEAIIPASDNLEIQLAARYEDYGDEEGGDTFDPKVGVRWSLNDTVMLRGSIGTSFQAPSIRNLAGSVGSGALSDSATGVAAGSACGGVDSFNAAQITTGADLDPQSATNFNLGAVFQRENFTGSIDYWNYDYEDLIQTGDDFQDILDNECATGIYTPDARVVRDSSGQLNSVISSFVNIGSVQATGFDLTANYEFGEVAGGNLSLFGIGTLITDFDIDQDGSGNGFDGANNRNRFIGFGSLPDTRLNIGLDWNSERHSARIVARHVGAYDDRTPTDDSRDEIESQTFIDVQYGFVWDHSSSGTTNVTVGVNNLFDEDPAKIDDSERIAYDGEVADPRGRIAYLRARYSF